jgi:glucosyl-dolichyl phosphate glucuronosyltransferase
MFVSIIIPTYNRSKLIGITLDSLLKQSYPKELFEILVVDNNSTDNTSTVIDEWIIKSEGRIRYFVEPRQGSHFARNGVVQHARGDLLYFTDDDMIADSNLLSGLVSIFKENPNVGTATGRVIPKWEIEPPVWVKKYCTNGWLSLYDREEEIFISDDDFGVFSCHQAVRKEAFILAGGYNPDIVNGEWLGDNETGLNIKIKSLGYQFAFIRSSVTQHMIPPHRMTQLYLNKRFANQGNCDCYTDFRAYHYTDSQLIQQINKHRRQMMIKFFKFVYAYFIGMDKWHIHRAMINYYASRIKYDKRILKDNDWRKMVLVNDWINN